MIVVSYSSNAQGRVIIPMVMLVNESTNFQARERIIDRGWEVVDEIQCDRRKERLREKGKNKEEPRRKREELLE